VLLAFSCHNRATGYCQSLNFVAGFLLLVLPSEETAFYALVRIVEELCPGYYAASLQGKTAALEKAGLNIVGIAWVIVIHVSLVTHLHCGTNHMQVSWSTF